MKKDALKVLRENSYLEILVELKNLKRASFNLRLMRSNQTLTDFSAIKKNRRSIAQVKTLLSEIKCSH